MKGWNNWDNSYVLLKARERSLWESCDSLVTDCLSDVSHNWPIKSRQNIIIQSRALTAGLSAGGIKIREVSESVARSSLTESVSKFCKDFFII